MHIGTSCCEYERVVVSHTVAKLANGNNLLHITNLCKEYIAIFFITDQCITYSFSDLQYSRNWLQDIF